LRDPDVGRSLTIHPDPDRGLDPVGRVDLGLAGLVPVDLVPVDLDQVVLAVTGLVDPGDRVDLRPVDRVDLDLGLVGLVGRELQDLTDRADLVAPVGRADLVGLVDLGLGRVDLDLGLVGLVVLAVTGLVDRVDRVGLAGLGDLVDPRLVGPADLVDQGVTGLVDLAGRVDRHRLGTHPGAHTIGVTRKWAAPLTRRTALAFPTMARRLRPGSTGSAGMADPLPEGLHITGTGRRLRVAGTVLRLPVVGTVHGMGRRATWVGRRPISGRSITAATTPYRCSTRFSVDGASGSSAYGFRSTDGPRY
jgi:hypothetical protein